MTFKDEDCGLNLQRVFILWMERKCMRSDIKTRFWCIAFLAFIGLDINAQSGKKRHFSKNYQAKSIEKSNFFHKFAF